MHTFTENLQAAWHQGYLHAPAPQSAGLWLLMLKDNVQNESPEFGMMSIMANPEEGNCVGTFVYADESEDISYHLEWSYREPSAGNIMDHFAAYDPSNYRHHDIIMGSQEGNPEVMGISLERPGEHPLVFVGVRMADEIPDCS